MKLWRYITRRHDFACYWRSLPYHGLLKSNHIFLWSLILLFQPMSIFPEYLVISLINQVIFLSNSLIFLHNLFVKLFIYLYKNFLNLITHLCRLCYDRVILEKKVTRPGIEPRTFPLLGGRSTN